MSHHHVGVKAQGSVDADFGQVATEEGGKPSTFSRVHKKKYDVVIRHEFLEGFDVFAYLLNSFH